MKRKIAVLCGSESDLNQITPGLALLQAAQTQELIEVSSVEICSAHRNPSALRELLKKFSETATDVVIVCAGKLAALFGDSDAISRNELHNNQTHFVAVPLKGKTRESTLAAYLSAKEVPNSQFIFREEFFENPEEAFVFAISGELPKITLKDQKPTQHLNIEEAQRKGRRKYPEKASYENVINQMEANGLIHMYTGKTRETFLNPVFPDLLFILATDRISIFDIVLNTTISGKGAVLTAMTIHWLKNLCRDIPNHLVAYGDRIMGYLPSKMFDFHGGRLSPEYLMKNMLVVKKTKVLKVEAIVRGYLTGSGLKDYKATGKVCGIELPKGLIDGSELPEVIFTPSTKADYGSHDENISFEEAEGIIGNKAAKFVRETALYLYQSAKDSLLPRGIIIADTKFEFGVDPTTGKIILIDEVLTPDSSRFWPEDGRVVAMAERKTPPSFDKQPIRDAGKAAGIKSSNPEWVPSDPLIAETIANYQHIVELATGKKLQQFWSEDMDIS